MPDAPSEAGYGATSAARAFTIKRFEPQPKGDILHKSKALYRALPMLGQGEITLLLAAWSRGDQAALDRLVPVVYDELHRLASSYMRGERPDHLLQTTALVNEAYLRLAGRQQVSCETRNEFFAIAAQVMRRVLVDYARGRNRAKRGDGITPLDLDAVPLISADRADEIIATNSALDRLAAVDPRKARVFELRYFGGMSVDETAAILKVSPVTVARDWRLAKGWLRREMALQLSHAT